MMQLIQNEIELLTRLKKGDIKAFKQVILAYAPAMMEQAQLAIEDVKIASEIVDDVLYRSFTESDYCTPDMSMVSLEAFFYIQVRIACQAYENAKMTKK